MVLSMLSSLQDPEEWVFWAFSDYNLDYLLEKKGISASDNEIACNWILKKIYNTHWHFDRILQDLDRILPKILIGSYPGS